MLIRSSSFTSENFRRYSFNKPYSIHAAVGTPSYARFPRSHGRCHTPNNERGIPISINFKHIDVIRATEVKYSVLKLAHENPFTVNVELPGLYKIPNFNQVLPLFQTLTSTGILNIISPIPSS